MARFLSVTRRRSHLIDLNLRIRPDIASYQFFAATNFDAVFTQFDTVPATGKRSPSVADVGMADGQYRGLTRFLFDPTDYTGSVPAVDDSKPFFVQVKPVSTAGVVGSAEAMHLILPYDSTPNRTFILSGNAPNQASLASSLEIQLPMLCNDWEFQNNGGAILFVAFEPTGAEYVVDPVSANFISFKKIYSSISQIFVRGNGAATAFTALFTLRNNPTT